MPEHQPTEHEHIVYALYNTLLLILCPVVLGAAVTRDWKLIGPRALRERWGIYPRVRTGQPVVWMHAASVGETVAAGPIVRELIALRPDVHIVFSSITATGRETAEQILPNVDRPTACPPCHPSYNLCDGGNRALAQFHLAQS